jgi:hypothetical protein
MKATSHQFHGRVRLRFPQLKGAPLLAAQVAASVRQVEGVVSVEPSPATGSMLVVHGIGGAGELQFWSALEQALALHGLSTRDEATARQQRAAPSHGGDAGGAFGASVAGQVAGKFVDALVGKLAERSALALVAALL